MGAHNSNHEQNTGNWAIIKAQIAMVKLKENAELDEQSTFGSEIYHIERVWIMKI